LFSQSVMNSILIQLDESRDKSFQLLDEKANRRGLAPDVMRN
jgi:hypothetical protein